MEAKVVEEDTSPSPKTTPAPPTLLPLDVTPIAEEDDDTDMYYTPPIVNEITPTESPALLPADDLSHVYAAVLERKLKRKPSQPQISEEAVVYRPSKRVKREVRQAPYRRPVHRSVRSSQIELLYTLPRSWSALQF